MSDIRQKAFPFDRVVLVHGFRATIADHWFPWLAQAVPNVERVALPHPEAPDARIWIPLVTETIGALTPGTAIVTHSLGGITALRAIQHLAGRSADAACLGAFVAVAPFSRALPTTGAADLDEFSATGLPDFVAGLDAETIRGHCGRACVIRSDDDPLVPAGLSEQFATIIGAHVTVVRGAGHFLASNQITALPAVVDALTGARWE